MVDGKPGTLPAHIVELNVIETERPPVTDNEVLTADWVADLEAMEYRQVYSIREKTLEEMAPEMVTKAQGLIQLEAMGLYDTVIAMVAQMTKIEQIVFEATKEWEQDNALISKMADALGLSHEEKLQFFIDAGKIVV
jgi:hypothetical protein